mmetsp:Transcript_79431/g.199602  ORF Transcript_79431/g.199602 Transcript_79431/m.199602 type:complete len:137 (-) Transcript_79431:487-897(-)|eukprot:CAMPEP_0115477264 /NCGR_PEP_ID=MMETSP0271-20121206/55580_1 /TAXON_ID=71861 /ORGANISM="Scrippsiella trochoidea, Strain CCMP3099" /LENGTH=136 /DNA_ID=CAMNT_0002904737 /DNA_START=55 /DNA_END=465 /DNA_ORIENTATION=-
MAAWSNSDCLVGALSIMVWSVAQAAEVEAEATPSNVNATALGGSDAATESEDGDGTKVILVAVGAAVLALCAGYQVFRYLVSPKKTPAPLLADNELGEGDPVQGASGGAMWMGGGGGLSQARQMVGEQHSTSFTQM